MKTKQYTIGIDIGGTNIKGALFDGDRVVLDYSLGTPKDNLDHLLIMMKAVAEPLLERAKKDRASVPGIGLGIAGTLDLKRKKITHSANLPFITGSSPAARLEEMLGLPVKMDNDTACFVRAEALKGAGVKYKSVYGITLGTGIGTSWWHNGEVHIGAHGGAGELGHMLIDFDNGITLEKAYQKLIQNSPATLAEEAYRGDTLAEKTFTEIGKYLGIALANIVNGIDPEIFIIGGGVSGSDDLFFSQIKKSMREYVISGEAKKIKILKSKLGTNSAAIGAALL